MTTQPARDGSDAHVVLRLIGSPQNVRTARLVAAATARRTDMSESCIDEVRIGVGEAVTWAIQRAQGGAVEVVVTTPDGGDYAVSVRRVQGPGASAVHEPMDSLAMALLTGLADEVAVDDDGVTLSWHPDSWA